MQLITLKSAFDEFDVDGSSYISADEMGQALMRLGLQPTPQEIQVRVWLRTLRAAFPRHSPVTEAAAAPSRGPSALRAPCPVALQDMMKEADIDGDGEISFLEFMSHYQSFRKNGPARVFLKAKSVDLLDAGDVCWVDRELLFDGVNLKIKEPADGSVLSVIPIQAATITPDRECETIFSIDDGAAIVQFMVSDRSTRQARAAPRRAAAWQPRRRWLAPLSLHAVLFQPPILLCGAGLVRRVQQGAALAHLEAGPTAQEGLRHQRRQVQPQRAARRGRLRAVSSRPVPRCACSAPAPPRCPALLCAKQATSRGCSRRDAKPLTLGTRVKGGINSETGERIAAKIMSKMDAVGQKNEVRMLLIVASHRPAPPTEGGVDLGSGGARFGSVRP